MTTSDLILKCVHEFYLSYRHSLAETWPSLHRTFANTQGVSNSGGSEREFSKWNQLDISHIWIHLAHVV